MHKKSSTRLYTLQNQVISSSNYHQQFSGSQQQSSHSAPRSSTKAALQSSRHWCFNAAIVAPCRSSMVTYNMLNGLQVHHASSQEITGRTSQNIRGNGLQLLQITIVHSLHKKQWERMQSRFTKRKTPATYKSFQTSSSIDTIYQSAILTLQALYISQRYHGIKCMPVLSNRAC